VVLVIQASLATKDLQVLWAQLGCLDREEILAQSAQSVNLEQPVFRACQVTQAYLVQQDL